MYFDDKYFKTEEIDGFVVDSMMKRAWAAEMEIMQEIDRICKENDLQYYAAWGTLLGTIRHKGFIPWDDDIDVVLPRKDFNKMIEVFKRDYSDKYSIANVETMENYPLMTTRLMLKGTKFVEEPLKNLKCELGIFLDIYPYDNIPDSDEELKKQAKRAWFWSKVLILRHVAFPVLPYKGFKAKLTHAVTGLIHAGMVVFRISHKWIAGKCLEIANMYNDKETKRMAFLFDTNPYWHIMVKEEAFPLQIYDFEDVKMPLPACEDKKLRKMYGNYMELPPVEKRKNHYPYKLEFND